MSLALPPLPPVQRADAHDEIDELRRWWSRLSGAARAAFLGDPSGPIPREHLDDVMGAGIRLIGSQAAGAPMVWSFPPATQAFIGQQRTPGSVS